jgi:thiamine kinase-like enzyme
MLIMRASNLFRGTDITCILRDLERYEANSGLFPERVRKKMVFLKGSNRAEVCGYLKKLTQWQTWRSLIGGSRSFNAMFQNLGTTTSHARALMVKNNVLGFYPHYDLVCKFWLYSGVRAFDALQNEAKTNRVAEKLNFFKVPKIILIPDQSSPVALPVIWYKYIRGKKPGNKGPAKEEAAYRFLQAMLPWYQEHGIDFVKPVNIHNNFNNTISYERLHIFGWDGQDAVTIMNALKKVVNCSMVMPVSRIHGDASVGNLIIDKQGRIVILDWEKSRQDYIAFDLSKLINQGGTTITDLYSKWLRRIYNGSNDIMPVEIQNMTINILKYLDIASKKKYLTNIYSLQESEVLVESIRKRTLLTAQKIDTLL